MTDYPLPCCIYNHEGHEEHEDVWVKRMGGAGSVSTGLQVHFLNPFRQVSLAFPGKLQNKTPESIFQPFDIKINQKPLPYLSQLHISKQLHLVDAKQTLDTFEFQYDLLMDQDIDAIAAT